MSELTETAAPGPVFAAELQELIRAVFRKFVSADGLEVDYKALWASDEFRDYVLKSEQLADFKPITLESRGQRLAFWINLYNIMVIHKVELLGVGKKVREAKGFFDHGAANIGGFAYSLNDIEYGILRGNARRSPRAWRHLLPWDVRRRLALAPAEPRVCFALVRASRSSPPLRFYEEDWVEGQLHRAAAHFFSHGGVVIDRERDIISLSRLFHVFSPDFGGDQGVMRFIAGHLESPDDAAFIRVRAGKSKVKFQDFDWSLNGKSDLSVE